MKLRVGLVTRSFGWEQLCTQEGVASTVLDLSSQTIADECSILIVNRELNGNERDAVEEYLRQGGAILGQTQHLLHLGGIKGTEQPVKYVVAGHDDIFPSVHLLDVGVDALIPRGANALRTDTDTHAVAAGPLSGGHAVLLPFDVDAMMADTRTANKNFHFTLDRLPSERVSLAGKGELHHLIHCAFQYLHHVRGLPYVHLWYFPNDARNVFAFRIDSDGGSREDIDALYRLARENDIRMSWFLDVKSHESWLDHFRYFVGQECGLHCYEHQTYPTLEANLRNITHGLHAMRKSGMNPAGFTAPFGMWNAGLAKAIDQAGFEYSSEFSYAYDAFPLYAESMGMEFHTLQVPIHPVCIGSMLRVGYSDVHMSEYFATVVDRKLSRNEPLLFYHHPSHRHWNVVRDLFSIIRQNNIENMTFGDFARWWKRRADTTPLMQIDGFLLEAESSSPVPEDVYIRVIKPDLFEAVFPLQARLDLREFSWVAPAVIAPLPDDIRRTRDFDPRQMLGTLYNTLIRKLK